MISAHTADPRSPRRRGRKGSRLTIAGLAVAMVATGCSFNPDSIPAPSRGGGDFDLSVDLSSALNLPAGAGVTFDGVPVGTLKKLATVHTADGDVARAELSLEDNVRIPTTATVTLRQNTLLGDTYVAIISPEQTSSAPTFYQSGGVIPLAQATQAAQIEDVLVAVANFLGSNSLTQVGETFALVDSQLPDDPTEMARLTRSAAAELTQLAGNIDSVRTILDGISGAAAAGHAKREFLGTIFSPEGSQTLLTALRVNLTAADTAGMVGDLLATLSFAAPLLGKTAGVVNNVLKPLMFPGWPNTQGRPPNLANVEALLRDSVVPWLMHGPKVNITGINVGDVPGAPDAVGTLMNIFRMTGVGQ